MRDPLVVYMTDGAPRSEYFWHTYGSREKYAASRAAEAKAGLATVGVNHFHFLDHSNPIADQELFLNLDRAYASVAALIEREIPDAILTLAYEGGHPDHDACAFLASIAGREFALPVWEFPLYRRTNGEIQWQSFHAEPDGIAIQGTAEELARKRRMVEAHVSQHLTLAEFELAREIFRPMYAYDFSRVPHEGQLNYEAWQWPMKGSDVCEAFTQFLKKHKKSAGEQTWGTVA